SSDGTETPTTQTHENPFWLPVVTHRAHWLSKSDELVVVFRASTSPGTDRAPETIEDDLRASLRLQKWEFGKVLRRGAEHVRRGTCPTQQCTTTATGNTLQPVLPGARREDPTGSRRGSNLVRRFLRISPPSPVSNHVCEKWHSHS
ncbi:hypothetical protein CSUI_008183, partial [Cystoisospora suis]